jgi:ALG3 protein
MRYGLGRWQWAFHATAFHFSAAPFQRRTDDVTLQPNSMVRWLYILLIGSFDQNERSALFARSVAETSRGWKEVILRLGFGCALPQLLLGAPFLLTYPVSYLRKAFELDRVFFYQWTVNWKVCLEKR